MRNVRFASADLSFAELNNTTIAYSDLTDTQLYGTEFRMHQSPIRV